jgi:beta-glucosidase
MVLGYMINSKKEGQAAKKYEDLKKGLVGSMLNVKVKDVKTFKKNSRRTNRLGIPLLVGGWIQNNQSNSIEAASWVKSQLQ